MARITLWFVASAPLWIGGAPADPAARLVWWAFAIALEYAGPLAYFRIAGAGGDAVRRWGPWQWKPQVAAMVP